MTHRTIKRSGEIHNVGRLSSYLYGQRFGKLIVERLAEQRNNRKYWLCNCDCGKQRIVVQADLKTGKINSCRYCEVGAVRL
jgi:hypothetical protein